MRFLSRILSQGTKNIRNIYIEETRSFQWAEYLVWLQKQTVFLTFSSEPTIIRISARAVADLR